MTVFRVFLKLGKIMLCVISFSVLALAVRLMSCYAQERLGLDDFQLFFTLMGIVILGPVAIYLVEQFQPEDNDERSPGSTKANRNSRVSKPRTQNRTYKNPSKA